MRIPIHYDFASSLCYVAHRVMERLAPDLETLGIETVWEPIDLTWLTGWRRGDEVAGSGRENALRVSKELRVPLRMPTHWTDSRAATAVALALAGELREASWRERVFSALFEEGRDIGDPDELVRLARDVDIGPEVLDGAKLGAVEVQSLLAMEAGVTCVPTFVLGGWPLGGIQDEDTMRSVLGRYVERRTGGKAPFPSGGLEEPT